MIANQQLNVAWPADLTMDEKTRNLLDSMADFEPPALTGDEPALGPDPCVAMAKDGDVSRLLDWLRKRRPDQWDTRYMELLGQAARTMAARDPTELVNLAFGEILGFAIALLARSQLHVEKRLTEFDREPGERTIMPRDLLDEAWIERVERISRFIAEMSTMRGRPPFARIGRSDAWSEAVEVAPEWFPVAEGTSSDGLAL